METRRSRAFRIRPMLAAVMPFPREEVTPPVTKTYFALGQSLRGFFECYRKSPSGANRTGRPPPGRPQRRHNVATMHRPSGQLTWQFLRPGRIGPAVDAPRGIMGRLEGSAPLGSCGD